MTTGSPPGNYPPIPAVLNNIGTIVPSIGELARSPESSIIEVLRKAARCIFFL